MTSPKSREEPAASDELDCRRIKATEGGEIPNDEDPSPTNYVAMNVYEAAVKGRRDFRAALKEARAELTAKDARIAQLEADRRAFADETQKYRDAWLGDQKRIAELEAEVAEYRANYEGACKTVAEMHLAAMGGVIGPRRGVVEDVADLRALLAQAAEAIEKIENTPYGYADQSRAIASEALSALHSAGFGRNGQDGKGGGG